MNTFKKKSLNAALAGISVLGAVGAAQAVNINPDGLGQVLIYPYYTTRVDKAGNAFNSILTVVNSTQTTKAVKVRFVEGKNSREVLDFNLFLSPYDVWSANVVPNAGTGGAMVITDDKSCTLPKLPSMATPATPDRKGKDFVNFGYTGSAADGADTSLDRTREGYIEIIEMATYDTNTTTYDETLHDTTGTPKCGPKLNDATAANEAEIVQGGLFGALTLINVFSGTDFAQNPTVLDNFAQGTDLYANAGSISPDLTNVTPKTSVVIANNTVVTSTWTGNGVNPVSAVLMHNQVLNEFVSDVSIGGVTDWVVTFPTKRYYVSKGTGPASGGLFQRNFDGNNGSCDDISLNIYDREEQTTDTPLEFSPPPPQGVSSLCWEANVLNFNNSGVFGSKNGPLQNVSTGFKAGWLNLGFFPTSVTGTVHTLGNAATIVTPIGSAPGAPGTFTYYGLPLVGFAAVGYQNGTIQGAGGGLIQSNYGGAFKHRVTTQIQ